jgi:transcriptional regulator GlxA family with amidase domain
MADACTLLVVDGVSDGAVGISLDVLGAAKRIVAYGLGEGRAVAPPVPRIVSLDGRPVRTGAGRTLTVDGVFSPRALGRRSIVVVPGLGMATPEAIDEALAGAKVRKVVSAIADAAARGALVAASCSATFLVGAAGVLDGGEATTTWWLAPDFVRRFPRVALRVDRMVVTSGSVITAGSAFAHVDLMLAILSRVGGPSLARLVSRYLVIDERPSQARYTIADHLRSDDEVVRTLERFVLTRIAQPLTLGDLARATATSPRTLARRLADALGTTPLRFVQRLRVERAVHLLETTSDPIDAIAAQVGYADPAAFRRVLRRETGRAPSDVRRGR